MLSKKASLKLKFILEKINGNDPNAATLIHDKDVKRNACCKLIFLL
jgi:hypothetical protein